MNASPLHLVEDDETAPSPPGEQLSLPALRLSLVAPAVFDWPAVGPILIVLLGGHVEQRRRICTAHGPWMCCSRHRRRFRETYGCRDCCADLLSWRPAERPAEFRLLGSWACCIVHHSRHRATSGCVGCQEGRPEWAPPPPAVPRKPGKAHSLGTGYTRQERADARTINTRRLPVLPATYGECKSTPRPCLLFRCRHNLWLDVNPNSGSIKLNFPGLDPHEVEHTCSIDAALDGAPSADPEDRVMHTLEQIGEWMNMTTVRAGQLVTDAIEEAKAKLLDPGEMTDRGTDEVDEFADEPTVEESEDVDDK